jgi:hypothetical protein
VTDGRPGLRIDTLRDEPLLAALPASHRFAQSEAIPLSEFVAEPVLLAREPTGRGFNAWLQALLRVHGVALQRTVKTLGAPWDRRMLPVAHGEAVAPVVAEWAVGWPPGLVTVPFDPPLSFPIDLATRWPPTETVRSLIEATLRLRDAEGWLTERGAHTELPSD